MLFEAFWVYPLQVDKLFYFLHMYNNISMAKCKLLLKLYAIITHDKINYEEVRHMYYTYLALAC